MTNQTTENQMELIGCHADERGMVACDKCGSTKLRKTMHIDGTTYFTNAFTCENGHQMSVKQQRQKGGYWDFT